MRPNQVEQGFSLVEVLVAISILGVVLTALISALLANTSLNSREVRRADAVRISEKILENYRQSTDYGSLRDAVTSTETRGGVQYTANTTFCPSEAPDSMACTPTAVYIRVEVKHGNQTLHKAETYYARFGSTE